MTWLLSVTAFYAPHPGDTRGLGILFPRAAGVRALGVLFNSDMFAGRGDTRSETWIHGHWSRETLPAIHADIERCLAVDRLAR